jgi:hypothetical protein
MGKRKRFSKDLARQMYTYFVTYKETVGAPSFSKFARSIGATLADVLEFRDKNSEFRRAFNECNEIRRDYLIDNALAKRFDGSVTKFLLTAEYGMGEKEEDRDSCLDVKIEVIDSKGENGA